MARESINTLTDTLRFLRGPCDVSAYFQGGDMLRVCCYCGKIQKDKLKLPPGLPPGSVTHIICKSCYPRANAEVDEAIRKLKEKKS